MVVDGRIESNGVEAPAVTVCGRRPQFSRGWRENVTVNCGIVELMCGDAEDIEGCIETKTFYRSEMVKDVLMGYMTRKSLVNENNPWIEDFTRSPARLVARLNGIGGAMMRCLCLDVQPWTNLGDQCSTVHFFYILQLFSN